jgi:hypothetical protein
MGNLHQNQGSTSEGAVSALTGNGEICTTLGPTGYHSGGSRQASPARLTQHFVWAGRRIHGPQHELADFGTLTLQVSLDGRHLTLADWKQSIDPETGIVHSTCSFGRVLLRTRSFVSLPDNLFYARTTALCTGDAEGELAVTVTYTLGQQADSAQWQTETDGAVLTYAVEQMLGEVRVTAWAEGADTSRLQTVERRCTAAHALQAEPGSGMVVTTAVQFSDRLRYTPPISRTQAAAAETRQADAWTQFASRSRMATGCAEVDAFRAMGLYTLRCQWTPWSVPASLSVPYWGGGAFHDEMYPFMAMLSAGHTDLAKRCCYFRLATLPKAIARGLGRGALYPWSSTEAGDERDPHGNWLTERFHLGQFAACIAALWEMERDPGTLAELYPVLRAVTRYLETQVVEELPGGGAGTRPCVDFDESVGIVRNGPYTIGAAAASLGWAAQVGQELGVDQWFVEPWRRLSAAVARSLPMEDGCFAIPDAQAFHYSVLGPIYPFRLQVGTPAARRTAAKVHQLCRSGRAWRPGFSAVFDASEWMWTAGHLAIVHSMHQQAQSAWEAVQGGPASAGPYLSPNEHVAANGEYRVPWFTTGVGAWLYGLQASAVHVDGDELRVAWGISPALERVEFAGLAGPSGTRVSGMMERGRIIALSVTSDADVSARLAIPAAACPNAVNASRLSDDGRAAAFELRLVPGETVIAG